MKSFLAIVKQTIRSAMRAKVFHVLGIFILLAVFLLPMTVSGDGTAKSLMQVSVSYSLGIVVALISTTTLWLACSQLSVEIEKYTIHLEVTKPCPRWKIWLGKWVGIFGMNALILIVSMFAVFFLLQGRIAYYQKTGRFTKQEIEQLDKEIRVGRRTYRPDVADVRAQVDKEYARTKDNYKGRTETEIRMLIANKILSRDGVVNAGGEKRWRFRGVVGKDKVVFLRYRIYSGSTTATDQREMPGFWGVRDPKGSAQGNDVFAYLPVKYLSGTFQEVRLTSNCIDKEKGNLIGIQYVNPPKTADVWGGGEAPAAVFQTKDGPEILVAVASFMENYLRAMFLAILQIAFLAALGCTVSAAFSTPVAAFVAVTYLVIGLSVHAAIDAPLKDEFGAYKYTSVPQRIAHYMAFGVGEIVVSVDDLSATKDLSRGRLVENGRLVYGFISLFLLRTGLMALVGIWILNKRELGLVVRR